MTKIKEIGFKKYYIQWAADHPGAIGYEKLVHYIEHGDEFGRKVPVHILAGMAKTTKTTMLKWLKLYAEEKAPTQGTGFEDGFPY